MNNKNISREIKEEKLPAGSIFLDTVKGTFVNQYTLIAMAAVIPAAIAMSMGGERSKFLSVAAAAVILALTFAAQNIALGVLGRIKRDDRIKNNNSLDPRLMGTLGDISGIGSTFGVLAGIAVMLSCVYIAEGGIFSGDNFTVPLLEALAQAISVTAMLTAVTSRENMGITLYLITVFSADLSGKNALKRASKITKTPELMKGVRNMAVVRLTAACAFSAAVIICALSGAGSPYSCTQAAWLYLFTAVLSTFSGKPEEVSGGEKQTLWTKNYRPLCVINIVMFAAMAFFFLFSFPIRSVYTDYQGLPEYDYFQVVNIEEKYPAFSVPEHDSTDSRLFGAFFLVSAFLPVIASCSAVSLPDVKTRVGMRYICPVITSAAVAAVTVMYFAFYGAFSAVEWTAAAGIICFMILINMVRGFFASRGYKETDLA